MFARPSPPPCQLDAIPLLLRQTPHWVLWRFARLLGADGGVRWTCAPVNVHTGGLARVSVPATWGDFATVAAALPRSRCDGLGFVLHRPPDTPPGHPGLVVLDLDHCCDPHGGRLADWARDVVEAVGSYTEWSPSGLGVRVVLQGVLPTHGRRKGDYENYQAGRFVAVTGRRVPGTPAAVEHRQEALLRVHGWFFLRNVVRKRQEAERPHPGSWGNACTVPLPFGLIDARLQRLLGTWPRRVGARLFAVGAEGPLWLNNVEELFAWIGRRFDELRLPAPEWQVGVGCVTRAEYFRHLQQFATPERTG